MEADFKNSFLLVKIIIKIRWNPNFKKIFLLGKAYNC